MANASNVPTLGKSELCAALGWGRSTLDRRLDKDPSFPIIARGGPGKSWAFDLAKVTAYLSGQASDGGGQVASERLTGGEGTARQRRDAAQAALLEDKLRRERGELIEVERLRLVLDTAIGRLGKWLDGFPEQAVKILGLPEDRAEALRAHVDEQRDRLVDEITSALR
jgi:phage terminase Nu1 subunit (DNA packaging protein)